MGSEEKLSKVKDPVLQVVRWVKARSPREKYILCGLAGLVVSAPRGRVRMHGPGVQPGRARLEHGAMWRAPAQHGTSCQF